MIAIKSFFRVTNNFINNFNMYRLLKSQIGDLADSHAHLPSLKHRVVVIDRVMARGILDFTVVSSKSPYDVIVFLAHLLIWTINLAIFPLMQPPNLFFHSIKPTREPLTSGNSKTELILDRMRVERRDRDPALFYRYRLLFYLVSFNLVYYLIELNLLKRANTNKHLCRIHT